MRFSSLSLLFLAVILILGSIPSFADDGDDLSFVVTASRTPEESASAPAQVTVITAENIAASGASNLVEVLEQVPGIRFTSGMNGPGSESVSMRGFGENSFGRVLVIVDGKRLNNPDLAGINWNAVALADIERIEVLDGAASVQYGNNAVGGVINIITKKSGEARTIIGLSGGSFFENRESFSHFRPVPWGNFSITAEHAGTEGYRDRQTARVMNAAARSTIDLAESLSLTIQAAFADLYYQLPGGLSKAQYENDPTDALRYDFSITDYVLNWDDETSERHFSGGLSLQWIPNDILELELPLSYMGKLRDSSTASRSYFSSLFIHTGEARPQVSAVFDIAGMSLRLLGGVDFYYAYLDNALYQDKAKTGKTFNSYISEFTLGPYMNVRFDPLQSLTIITGGRFDTAFINAEKTASPSASAMDEKKDYTSFVYDGGISFRPIDSVKLYAKYATLFHYPHTDELASFYGTTWDSFNTNLKPERGFNAEAGIGFRLKELFSINGNIYYLRLEDELYVDPTTSGNENMDAETRRIGSNIGASVQPVSFLEFTLAYSWVNSLITGGQYKNNRIPLVPAHTVYGTITGKLPFGLSFGPTIEYRSASYQGGDFNNNQDQVEAYILYGAFFRYVLEREKQNLSIQVTGKNLLDTRHTSNVFYSTFPESAYYPGDGRSINVSVQYRF
jgi:iron complex outermembrane receptor protein